MARRRNKGPQQHRVGAEAGIDLAHYIQLIAPGQLSVRAARRALEQGCCRVNGRIERFGSRALARGDAVEFRPPAQPARNAPGTRAAEQRRVLHHDDDCLAYDKPPGLPVTAPERGGRNLLALLREEWGELHAVHRLDADTSGVVLLARSEAAADRLAAAFRKRQVRKRYLALVAGVPSQAAGERCGPMHPCERRRGFERWREGRGPGALTAHSRWRQQRRFASVATLLQLVPLTGRTHQLRVHCAALGCPIIGDRVYGGSEDPIAAERQLLHAETLEIDAAAGRRLRLRAGPPADFNRAMAELARIAP